MKFIELFAGIGGFRYGLERANRIQGDRGSRPAHGGGEEDLHKEEQVSATQEAQCFSCVWANEWDKYAAQIYRKHYGEIDTRDIRTVEPSEIPAHDLITAGFPCQSFSIAGKRKGFNDTRGTLFYEICRIARFHRTPYLLLENVKGLLNHNKGQTFSVILESLDELGYDCQWQVLNSKNFGVPQNRERVFIIGHLRGRSRPQVFPIGGGGVKDATARGLHEVHKGWVSQGEDGQEKEQCTGDAYHKEEGDSTRGERGTPTSIRRLTPTECERLQGFPDGWTGGISDTQRYKCLGNAVTTNVITAIGRVWG